MKNLTLISSLLLFSLCFSCAKESTEEFENIENSNSLKSKRNKNNGFSNTYIVVFHEDTNLTTESAMIQKISGIYSRLGISAKKLEKCFYCTIQGFTSSLTPIEYQLLLNENDVSYIEQDKVLKFPVIKRGNGLTPPVNSNSEIIPYNVTRVNGGNSAPYGYDNTLKAWIIDSGLDMDHPDLNIDASLSKGFDSSNPYPDGCYGHGTWVAGVLGAKKNGVGTVGVYPGVSLVSLNVADETCYNFTISSIIDALEYIASNSINICDVVNMSLGDTIPNSNSLDDAVISLASSGVRIIAAAGNFGMNANIYSPAGVNVPNFYTISAMDENEVFYNRSNWGPSIDYCAPSAHIYTTILDGGYDSIVIGATSLAAPHAAGVMLYPVAAPPANPPTVLNDLDGMPDEIIYNWN